MVENSHELEFVINLPHAPTHWSFLFKTQGFGSGVFYNITDLKISYNFAEHMKTVFLTNSPANSVAFKKNSFDFP